MIKPSFRQLLAATKETPEYKAQRKGVEFLAEIHALMQKKNVSKAQLAQKLCCSGAYITKLFTGSNNLTLETMEKLVKALDANYSFKICDRHQNVQWRGYVVGGKKESADVPNFSAVVPNSPWRSFEQNVDFSDEQNSAIAA